MRKKIFILMYLLMAIFTGIAYNSMPVKAVEEVDAETIKLKVTKTYTLSASDFPTEKNKRYYFPCGDMDIEVFKQYGEPLLNFIEGKGATINGGTDLKVTPKNGWPVHSFTINSTTTNSYSIGSYSNVEKYDTVYNEDGTVSFTIIPQNENSAFSIYLAGGSGTRTGIIGFSVSYTYDHKHEQKWYSNETHHWKECECGLPEYITPKESHTLVEDESLFIEPDHISSGTRFYSCDCGKNISEKVPPLGHTWDGTWYFNETHHWKQCSDNHETMEFDKAEHKWLFKETVNEPSIEEVGRAVYYCESCGREKEDLSYLNVTDANIKIEAVNSLTYTGKEQIQEVEVYYGDTKLTINEHYTLFNENRTDAGDYVLNITGIGTFRGETTFDYSIAKAPLTISVENYEITYSDLAPTFAVSYIGFVNEETETVLEGALSFACEYDQFDDVNEYVITASGLSSNNYEITYIDGKLKVNPKEIGLDWSNLNLIYNGKNQIPTATATGLLNDDECIVAVSGEEINAGTYTANAIALSNSNYKLPNVTTSQYTIEPKAIDGAVVTLKDTLVYTGTELTQEVGSVVLDGITLIKDVDYTIKENKGTVVDTYTLTVEGKGNYKGIITKDFEIIKQKVELPTANTDLIYKGSTQIGVESTELYDVVNGEATNAGSYEAVITLKDTANYEWAEEFNGKVVWTIAKATHNMSDVKFENVTVVYNGTEYVIEITGTLPEGVTVAYTTNKGTVVGTYNAVATFTYDTANYNTIADMNAVLTINKAKVALPEATSFVYDGTAHTAVASHDLYTVEGATQTNVGSYEATVTLKDAVNYEWTEEFNGKVTWTITKATHNMSGIKFENVTVTYDGAEHEVVINGTLPKGVTVSYTNNKGTNAGTYNAVATFTYDTANYNTIADMNAVLTINKFKVALPEVTTSFVYDGTAKVAVAAHDLYTVTEGSATNAGSYEAVVTLKDTANYEWAETFNGKVSWAIAKATYDMSDITFENVTVVYNGTEYVIEITGTLPAGVTVSYTNNKGTNAGTYNAVATFTYDTANYNTIADMNAVLTINKFKVELPEATTSFVYDGTAHTAVASHDLYTVTEGSATNAGSYEATVTLKDTANYEWTEEFNGKVAWTITKATHNMSGIKFENVTVTYDAAEHVVEITGTLPEGVTVAYTTNAGTNAGTYNAVATFTYDTANYNTIADMNAILTINKAKVELPEATTSFVYDGTAHTAVAAHDLYTVTEGSATNAGSYEAVVTLKDTANYEWAETFNGKVSWAIAKATYDMSDVKFENVTVTYDAAEHVVEITGTLPEGVTVAYTTNAGTNAGTYNAVATFTYDTANYNTIADMNAILTINKAKVELPEATTSFVYDGTAKVAIAAHDLYIVEGATATVVGSYEATVTLNDTANYEWADEFNGKVAWTITKATYDMSGVKFENVTVVYNGTEYVIEITGTLPEGVIVSYTNNKGTNAGTYNAVATFTYDTANYNTIADMNAVLTITKATYDMSGITFTAVTVTYDGAEHKVEIAGTLPSGVEVSYTTNKGTNAGTYNAVATFTYDAANYNTIADMNAVLTINKAKVALPEATTSFVYDGTAHTAVASHDLYTVTEGSATNAGSYEATVTLKDAVNYEWTEEFNGKVSWAIAKATYDMSGIKFENVTVTYDGAEHEVVINGTLPKGVTVSYTNNKGTNAGTYNAVATFTYDTANYNTIADMNAVLTINKFKVALPEVTTSFVYDGTAKVAVAAHDLYTVTEGSATNAGTYNAVVTLKDTANYEWAETFNGKVSWAIAKATYDMTNIKFENVTVVYNGTEYVIEITGTLPKGVTVSYTNNKGTNAGTYNAVATFTYDTANYNTIADMNAVLTINTDEHSYVNPETNVEDVIVSTEDGNGIDPKKEVKIEMVETEVLSESFDEFLDKKERVAIAYDVKLIQDGVEVQPDGILKIKILIPEELRDREFAIMHVHNGNETYMLEYEIEGDYVVFYTDKLSSFVFVYETGSILWLLIVFAVIVILEAGLLVFLLNKKKQFKLVHLAAAYPPFVFGMFLPAVQLVLFIILLVAIVALTTIDAIFGYELYGDKIKAFFKKDNDSKVVEQEVEVESTLDQEEIDPEDEEVEEPQQAVEEVVETEPVVEESTEDDDEEDVMQVWDEETHSFIIIRIIKSFTARLIQSKDEVKDYYDIIKNELLSYKKVKSRISFKHEAFKFGKDNVARLRFRGKTLCLYLALNPADYENTKYKIEDMSAISNSSDVPSMYRINLPRRADYAKELIYDLMKKLGAERMDIDYKEYSKEYPYEDNEALLEKGLIKKSVKVIGNGTSTKTLVNPVNIVKKVSASEVNDLITDEQVIELIEQSTRIADKTKKTIINIDTLSQYFNENETVTLEEIKKRIPNVEKKATYYKVLARGTLDKPLTVDADDFSIEAEKMIIVTGGKVLVSKAK